MAHRLDRLADRHHAGDLERTIAELAAAYGLHRSEVRAELAAIEERARRFSPSTLEQVIQQCAEEFGLPETDLWADYALITGEVAQ